MKLEVGKRYELANGEVHECTDMRGHDPDDVDDYGFGPFVLDGSYYHQNGTHGSGMCQRLNVIRCVEDTPTLWRDMTPEEKGALLLARHEGKVIENTWNSGKSWCRDDPYWSDDYAYRIKPEPKVETVKLRAGGDLKIWGTWTDLDDTHSITFNLIDGKPDPASIKMEEI